MSELIDKLIVKTQKYNEKKVRGIPLETVLVPHMTARLLTGDIKVTKSVLGHPLEVKRDAQGHVKLNNKGELTVVVNKEIRDHASTIMDNLNASIKADTSAIYLKNTEAYDKLRTECLAEAKQIIELDKQTIADYNKSLLPVS
jgi:hypothetical protein